MTGWHLSSTESARAASTEPHQESSRKVTKRWAAVPRAERRSLNLARFSAAAITRAEHADHPLGSDTDGLRSVRKA